MGNRTKLLLSPVETHFRNFLLLQLPLTSTWALRTVSLSKGSYFEVEGFCVMNTSFYQDPPNHMNGLISVTGLLHSTTPCFMIIHWHVIFLSSNDPYPLLHTTIWLPMATFLPFWSIGSLGNGIWSTLQFTLAHMSSMTWPLPLLHSDTSTYGNI